MIAVTGASGFVGSAVASALHADGRAVVGIVRRKHDDAVPQRVIASWTERELAQALAGADTVVHAASVVHRPGAPDDEYRRFNVEGTRALCAAASGARVVIFLSTIKVYGDEVSGVIDEDTPLAGEGSYAASKIEAERIVAEEGERRGFRSVILRLAPVFGVGDKGNVRRMIRAIARRRFVLPGDGAARKSLVHVSTVVSAVRASADRDVRGVYLVADRVAPSMRELSDTIASAIDRRRPISIPEGAVSIAARSLDWAARLAGRQAGLADLIRKSTLETVCSPSRLERDLGIDAHVDLGRAVAEEAAWMQRRSMI